MPSSSHPLSLEDLAASHRAGFKPRELWGIGLEVEKLAVDAATGRPIPYEGDRASVRAILEFMRRARPSKVVYEGRNPIALAGDYGTITLEPGGQIEWSSPPAKDLAEIESMLASHLDLLSEAAEATGVRFLQVAVNPTTPLEEMPWIPKQRYRIMREYFKTRGQHAHRMMTQTVSVQVSLDYSDERDWMEKFRAGVLLAPLFVAAFANSRQYSGQDSGYASFRSRIWKETDDDRCGAPDFVFRPDFTLDDWARYLDDLPMMFVERTENGLHTLAPITGIGSSPGTPAPFSFSRFRKEGWPAREPELPAFPTSDDYLLHQSEAFTEARTKTYVELRSADLPSDDRILAIPALWTGLLYDAEARRGAIELLGWNESTRLPGKDEWRRAMDAAAKDGLDAVLGSTTRATTGPMGSATTGGTTTIRATTDGPGGAVSGRSVRKLLGEAAKLAQVGLDRCGKGSAAARRILDTL